MLRCRNAAALRAQISTNLSLRAPSYSPWTSAPHTHHLRRFALSATTLRPNDSAETGGQYPGPPVTRYVNHNKIPHRRRPRRGPQDEQPVAENATYVPKPVRFTKSERSDDQERQSYKNDPFMQVAMGQAPPIPKHVLELELTWLGDPVKLANRVHELLTKKNLALAAELLRAALYKGYECDAAWNHIFKYCMKKNHPKAAFRFWNDMKKRGGKPNQYSYTHMLHGLATVEARREVDPLRMAKSIYQSMLDPKNSVNVSIIHTNAMLTVCQQQPGAMDLLWEIAGSLPEEGEGSPDHFTYSIILNAIRTSVQRDVLATHRNDVDKVHFIRLKGIVEAKKVWADVVYRWKKGQIKMSNYLVSAMAGCLWEGTGDRHLYDVLKLYWQTAGIPILAATPRDHMGVSQRAHSALSVDRPSEKQELEEEVPFVDAKGKAYSAERRQPTSDNIEAEIEELQEEEDSFSKVFEPIVSPEVRAYGGRQHVKLPDGPNYMPVGNRELSVILETALQMTVPVPPGKAYWMHLTQADTAYKIEPDHRSTIGYLRILRVGRGSRLAVDVLRDQLSTRGVEHGLPFHVALSVCRRDRKNPNILKNANDLLQMMDIALMMPDYRAIGTYLDLVNTLDQNPQDLVNMNGLGEINHLPSTVEKAQELGRQLKLNLRKSAVAVLRPHVAKLDDAMTELLDKKKPDLSGRSGVDPELVRLQSATPSELLALLTRVRLLIDTILKTEKGRLLSKEEEMQFLEDSRRLRKYSNIEVIKQFEDIREKSTWVRPTFEQQVAYNQRMGKIEREATRPAEEDTDEAALEAK